jgi:hypothetical protein
MNGADRLGLTIKLLNDAILPNILYADKVEVATVDAVILEAKMAYADNVEVATVDAVILEAIIVDAIMLDVCREEL